MSKHSVDVAAGFLLHAAGTVLFNACGEQVLKCGYKY